MARITFSLPDDLEPLIEARASERKHPSVSAYICALVEIDLTAAGLMPGTPAHNIRELAVAAKDAAGEKKTVEALQALIASGAEAAAEKVA